MFRRLLTWLQGSFSYIWLVALAVYFSVLAGQAIYRNYQAQQDSKALRAELAQAKQERERLEALVVYYKTDAFREKELRRSLLLRMPDEKVYALPESAIGKKAEEAEVALREQSDPRTSLPTWRQWFDYLLGRSTRA
ncbi:MAG TPA: septum formation initiator family protein [Verrucomicrobiae bacterium]|nr:septum formation initiator family protein [Verrucomicrobiae bacterium]